MLDKSKNDSTETVCRGGKTMNKDIEYDLVGYIPVDELLKAEQA